MAHYTKLHKNEIREITSRYGLEIIRHEPIEEGAGNTNYLVKTTQKQYILTVFEINHDRVVNLRNLLSLLKKYRYPTTRIQNLPGGNSITWHKEKPVLLKPYIVGEVIHNPTENMIRQVGVAMAKLHRIPSPEYLPDSHTYIFETFPNIIGTGVDTAYQNWLVQRYKSLMRKIPPGLPRGLIHGDIFCDNVLFEGKKFKAIIDFEDACQYYFILDLGMAVVGSCTKDSKIILPKVRSLVDGYQEIRRLKDGEKENFHRFIEFAAVTTSSWRFWKYNIDTPTAKKANTHLEMVKIAKDARSDYTKKVLKSMLV